MKRTNALCTINNLCIRFNNQKQPLFDNLSCTLTSGNLAILSGENGIGKSTLFGVLQGIKIPGTQISGTCILNNQTYNLAQPSSDLHTKVKTVHQRIGQMLAGNCTVIENLQLAHCAAYPTIQKMPTVLVPPIIKKIPHMQRVDQLSGGQQQLLAITMALQKKPEIVLLDEPTAALDSQNAQTVFDHLYYITQSTGIIIVIICHDQTLSNLYPHTKLILHKENGTSVLSQEQYML